MNSKEHFFINTDPNIRLIKEAMDENSLIGCLNQKIYKEIGVAFGIKLPENTDFRTIVTEIKEKLVEIISTKKQQSVQYVTQAYPTSLKDSTKIVLRQIVTLVWTVYCKKQKQVREQSLPQLCHSDNPGYVEHSHIGIFNYSNNPWVSDRRVNPFFNSRFNPLFAGDYANMRHLPQIHHFQMPNPDFTGKGSGLASEAVPQNAVSWESSIPRMRSTVSRNRREQQNPVQEYEQFHESFTSCACRGEKPHDEKERVFECQDCGEKMHLSCLFLLRMTKTTCPLCTLKKSNVFYRIIGKPLMTLWVSGKDVPKKTLDINRKTKAEIIKYKYNIQMMLFKDFEQFAIDGTSKDFEEFSRNRWPIIEAQIKHGMLNEKDDSEIKIHLNILNSVPPTQAEGHRSMRYLAVFMVSLRDRRSIMRHNFGHCHPTFLNRSLGERQSATIRITNSQLELMQNPARGLNCMHTDVFELSEFVDRLFQLNTDTCPVCERQCTRILIDESIKKQIQRIKRVVKNRDRYPCSITYRKQGAFEWEEKFGPKSNEK